MRRTVSAPGGFAKAAVAVAMTFTDLSPAEQAEVLARTAKPCRHGHTRDYFYVFRQRRGSIGIECATCSYDRVVKRRAINARSHPRS